jgi:hypothetical protein
MAARIPAAVGKALGLATRNAVQTLVPVLALVAHGTITSAGLITVSVGAGLAFLASLGKSTLGWHASMAAPWYLRLLDRVAPAAVGALLAVWPADLAGALATDWQGIAWSAGGAALTAFVMWLLEVLPNEMAQST